MNSKLLPILFLSATFSMSSLSAQDFLSEVTNGKLSDHSAGVHKLTLEEKQQVKGGYTVSDVVVVRNDRLAGGASIVEIGRGAMLYPAEVNQQKLCAIGTSNCLNSSYVNQQRFNEIASVLNPNGTEMLMFTATKTTGPGPFARPRFSYGSVIYDRVTGRSRRVNASHFYVISDLKYRYKNELDRILVIQHR